MTKKESNDHSLDSIWEYVLGDDKDHADQPRKWGRRRKVNNNDSIIDLLLPDARDESWQNSRREKRRDERDCTVAAENKVASTKLRNRPNKAKSCEQKSSEWSVDWELDPAVTSVFSFGEQNTKDKKGKKKESSDAQTHTGGYFFNHHSTGSKHASKTSASREGKFLGEKSSKKHEETTTWGLEHSISELFLSGVQGSKTSSTGKLRRNKDAKKSKKDEPKDTQIRRTMSARRYSEQEQYIWELDPAITSVFTCYETNNTEKIDPSDTTANAKHTKKTEHSGMKKKRASRDESKDWGSDPALSNFLALNKQKTKRDVESRNVETYNNRQYKSILLKDSDPSAFHRSKRCRIMGLKSKEETSFGQGLDPALSSHFASAGYNDCFSSPTKKENYGSKTIGAQKRMQPKRSNSLISRSKASGTKNMGAWHSLTSLFVARKANEQKMNKEAIEVSCPYQQQPFALKPALKVNNKEFGLKEEIIHNKKDGNSGQTIHWHEERTPNSAWPDLCDSILDYSSNSFSSQASNELSYQRPTRTTKICATSGENCKTREDKAAVDQSISHLIDVLSHTHMKESEDTTYSSPCKIAHPRKVLNSCELSPKVHDKSVGLDELMRTKENDKYSEPSTSEDGNNKTGEVNPCGIYESRSVNSILEELEHVNAYRITESNKRDRKTEDDNREKCAHVNVRELVSRLEKQTSTSNCPINKETATVKKSQTRITYQKDGLVRAFKPHSQVTLEKVKSQQGANNSQSDMDLNRKIDSILDKVEYRNVLSTNGAQEKGHIEDDDEIIFFAQKELFNKEK
jgi:hypothetical protein